jgi:hypothetical protein
MAVRFIVCTRKGLFDFARGSNGYEIARRSHIGNPVSMALRDDRDSTLYAAIDLGHFGTKLHRSSDEGANWEEVAVPSYEGVPASKEGEAAPALKLIWCLEKGADGALWAGTLPGGLFKSTDRGASWQLNKPLWDQPSRANWFGGGYDTPGIHSVCVDPRDATKLAVGVSCGGVWLSDDNGANWRVATKGMYADYMPPEQRDDPSIQDPHRLVQCPADPAAFWVQHHNGMFVSRDGCESWTSLTGKPSSFGFAVAVHPKDANTAWFATAVKDEFRYPVDNKFTVSRTRDGGKSFELLTKGLPAGESYDLIYRHGLAVDDTGDRLAMGSTTGNLWVSDNGGEEWTHLSAHLPPVFAVRWV